MLELSKLSRCIVCGKAFVADDKLRAWVRCPTDPSGSWANSVKVDAQFQDRHSVNADTVRRRHSDCVAKVGTVVSNTGKPLPHTMLADGSLVSCEDYKELFAVIGSQYGVGTDKFRLPDCRPEMFNIYYEDTKQ